MLRSFIDQFMGVRVALVLVLVHVAALGWAVLRKGTAPALLLNLILSATIVAYNGDHLAMMLRYADTAPLALTAFEAVTFVCAAGTLYGLRIPAWINWTAFAVNLALSALVLTFAWTFKMNRLF
jgi:hypothetical protein